MRNLAAVWGIVLGGCLLLEARADDDASPQLARPSAEQLAGAVLRGDREMRTRAAGWLASMNDAEILEVVEAIHRRAAAAGGAVSSPPTVRVELVLTQNGRPLPGVRVGLRRSVKGGSGRSMRDLLAALAAAEHVAISDAAGRAVTQAPAGPHTVELKSPGATTSYATNVDLASLARPHAIELSSGELVLRVVDRLGRACPGLEVDGWPPRVTPRWVTERVRTDVDGVVRLRGLPAGAWTFRARGRGGHIATELPGISLAGTGGHRATLVLQPYGTLRLLPRRGVARTKQVLQVTVTQELVGSSLGLDTDEPVILDLPPGTWHVKVDALVQAVQIVEGGTLDLPVGEAR